MYKRYAVVFQNRSTKKVFMDIYHATSESDAKHCFDECHWRGHYLALSITEIPD